MNSSINLLKIVDKQNSVNDHIETITTKYITGKTLKETIDKKKYSHIIQIYDNTILIYVGKLLFNNQSNIYLQILKGMEINMDNLHTISEEIIFYFNIYTGLIISDKNSRMDLYSYIFLNENTNYLEYSDTLNPKYMVTNIYTNSVPKIFDNQYLYYCNSKTVDTELNTYIIRYKSLFNHTTYNKILPEYILHDMHFDVIYNCSNYIIYRENDKNIIIDIIYLDKPNKPKIDFNKLIIDINEIINTGIIIKFYNKYTNSILKIINTSILDESSILYKEMTSDYNNIDVNNYLSSELKLKNIIIKYIIEKSNIIILSDSLVEITCNYLYFYNCVIIYNDNSKFYGSAIVYDNYYVNIVQGKLINKDGYIYEGTFAFGKLHGINCKLTYNNNQVYEGLFNMNKNIYNIHDKKYL